MPNFKSEGSLSFIGKQVFHLYSVSFEIRLEKVIDFITYSIHCSGIGAEAQMSEINTPPFHFTSNLYWRVHKGSDGVQTAQHLII